MNPNISEMMPRYLCRRTHMDTVIVNQQVLKLKNARRNLLLVIAFTAINVILTAFNASVYFLFSATAPLFLFELGRELAKDLQSDAFLMGGIAVAAGIIILYSICWFFAKRLPAFILVALIIFSLDSLMLIWLVLASGFEVSYFFDIIFHGWVLFCLISGVSAWSKLHRANHGDLHAVLQEAVSSEALNNDSTG